MSHSLVEYARLKLLVNLMRLALSVAAPTPRAVAPDAKFQIDNRSRTRKINVNVYKPKSQRKPSPVVLNWVACGFMLPVHGADEAYCQRIARDTDYVVLDASHALAPENPFPAALEDVEDVIEYVFSKPDEYDLKNIVLSGFSSGANLAFVAATNPNSEVPRHKIKSAIALYPVLDWETPPTEKKAPYGGTPSIPPFVSNLIADSYVPSGIDRRDPRISPAFADPKEFPEKVLMVVCGKDNLAPEAEELAKKLEVSGKRVTLKTLDDIDHGFDKKPEAFKEGTMERTKQEEMYSSTVAFLKQVYESG